MERQNNTGILPETYKGFPIQLFKGFFKGNDKQFWEKVRTAIDKGLYEHPEYLGDVENMYRLVTFHRGGGKPHVSNKVDGKRRDSFKLHRRHQSRRSRPRP